MDSCPVCGAGLSDALVICGHCGAVLPLRVIVVSEGSHGGGFALVEGADGQDERIPALEENTDGQDERIPALVENTDGQDERIPALEEKVDDE